MKKGMHLALVLLLMLIINPSIMGQRLGNFDLLTDPIGWNEGTANIGGQFFLSRNFAIYTDISNQEVDLNLEELTGSYRNKKVSGEVRFFPFVGVRKVRLFHPKYGRESRYMKRKYSKRAHCESFVGFGSRNPFPVLRGFYLGAGYQNGKENFLMEDAQITRTEILTIPSNKIVGRVGYQIQVEQFTLNASYKATYGKMRPEGSDRLSEIIYDSEMPFGFQEFQHTWQVQIGINF